MIWARHALASRRRATLGFAPAIAVLLASAPSALATPAGTNPEGPLLSGYGGPGAGQQAILGAELVNGAGRGRGGGGGPAGGSGTGSAERQASSGSGSGGGGEVEEGSIAAPSGQTTNPPSGGQVPSQGGTGGRSSHAGRPGSSAPAGVGAHGYHPTPGTQDAAVAAQPLGLSGADLIAVLVVACALLGVGLFTRSLARVEH